MNLIKSKERVKNHGEVFTPDFIVDEMLDLVKNETERIESRFLEPACGNGNFLIKILQRKLQVVKKKYKKNIFEYKRYSMLAVASIYGIDLLNDNVAQAQKKLHTFFVDEYKNIFKEEVDKDFFESIKYILSKNILQGNALNLKDKNDKKIIFSKWSPMNGSKIKRHEYIFEELIREGREGTIFEKEKGDDGKSVFIPESFKDYTPVSFLNLKNCYE